MYTRMYVCVYVYSQECTVYALSTTEPDVCACSQRNKVRTVRCIVLIKSTQ